jgi:hypothetical protein
MRLAMAYNLHAISTPNDLNSVSSPVLTTPSNDLEVCERINAFWGVFILDRMGSLVTGLDVAIPDSVRTLLGT